jgi:hypothetical protein
MRLGGEVPADPPPGEPAARLRRVWAEIDGVETRGIATDGDGTCSLLPQIEVPDQVVEAILELDPQ